jgi:hypothetical protein
MSTPDSETSKHELSLTSTEIYLAAGEGVLPEPDAERLVRWGYERRFNNAGLPEPKPPVVERRKGFNLVTVAYYCGAMLMISACAWFLGDKWKALGSPGILATVVLYIMIAAGSGWWLRNKGYLVGGSLLIAERGFIWIAVKLRRATFLVFGALGVYIYLGHLAYEVFKDSFFFPFVLALLGLSLILATVWIQRRVLTGSFIPGL